MSPTFSSQPTFTTPPLLSAVLAPVTQGAGKCLVVGCGQSCIANDCPCRVCQKHCIKRGGCPSKKHRVSTVAVHTASFIVPQQAPLVMPPPPFVVPRHLSSPPASTSLLILPESSQSPLSDVVDARPDPCFALHLHPIFTETLAQQHELRE